MARRGKREKRKTRIGMEGVNISIYLTIGVLIGLGGTAASTEVVNLSSIFGIVRVGLLLVKV